MNPRKAILCIVGFWLACGAVIYLATWWHVSLALVILGFVAMNYGAYRMLRQ